MSSCCVCQVNQSRGGTDPSKPAVSAHARECPRGADSSRRAFYREFVKVVDASDVIIEVLDARDPAAYRSPDVERYVRAAGSNKKIILLLNKIGAQSACSPRNGLRVHRKRLLTSVDAVAAVTLWWALKLS